ncbi:MAG: carbohydrate ABC transporter permease [Candidatus Sumerlaeaceae bacterium]
MTYIPKSHRGWTWRGHGSGDAARVPREDLSEEKLADYHSQKLHGRSIWFTLLAMAVLTMTAAVVIIPFIYMLLISLKGPAQVGNGQLLPGELLSLFNERSAWVKVKLNGQQAVALNRTETVPMLPTSEAPYSPWPEPKPLPERTIHGQKLSLERPDMNNPSLEAIVEVSGPAASRLKTFQPVTIYLPGQQQGLWVPVEGSAVPHSSGAVLTRMLRNYRILLDWDTLLQANVLKWVSTGYPRWFINSLFVAISTVLLGVFLDSLAAFAFAKYEFPFKRPLFLLLVGTLMIPYPVTLVPTFFIFAKLGFYNTYAALIIPGIVSAFGIFLVRQYMENIPDDMIAAARVDGASDFQVYRKIVLPTARPVLAALAVFRFIYQWNTYLYPLVLTNKDSMKTLQLGIATMEDVHGTVDYGMQMAGSALAVVPILLVYAFMQKHFIAGITMGSAKG